MSDEIKITIFELKKSICKAIADGIDPEDAINDSSESIKNANTTVRVIATELIKDFRGDYPTYLAEFNKDFSEYIPALKEIARKNNPYLIKDLSGFRSYIKSYNESNNYNCRIFPKSNYDKLIFSPGSIGIIGARTSRGKTTALVSTAVDALKQNKRVFFTTMEESAHQIELRFILNLLYSNSYCDELQNDDVWQTALRLSKFNPKRQVLKLLRGEEKEEGIADIFKDFKEIKTKDFIQNIHNAIETLEKYMKDGKLAIYNGMESPSFEDMRDAMSDNDAGDIVLLDYIQKVKPPRKFNGAENRFAILQNATQELANMTKKTNIILISGAQFGRTGEKFKSNTLDMFTDESFQECSAIEQAGEIEIGIGRHFKDNVKHTYYSILKDRDNGEYDPNIYYELEDVAKYSHFSPLRREEKSEDSKFKNWNLVKYYDVNRDIIDGESKEERNVRVFGKSYSDKKKKGKSNESETSSNPTSFVSLLNSNKANAW